MKQITLRAPEDLVDELDEEYKERGFESRSELIREILEDRERVELLEERVDELEDRLEDREDRIRELEDQLRARRDRQEDVTEIVEYVQEERALRERERRRQDKRASAGIGKRAYWWVFGMDLDDVEK